jgi:hypothetical protein
MRLSLLLCFSVVVPQLGFADQPITTLIDTTFENRIAELTERDVAIDKLVGRRIGSLVVASVTHLGRLDPSALANGKLGARVNLRGLDEINTEYNFADFQSSKPTKNDSIEISVIPEKEDIGKTYVVVFNVNAFGNYSYHKTKRIGAGIEKRFGRVSGIDRGVSNISFHFRVDTDERITLTLVPETDDRWWFGSCDLYVLGE